jgi:hypothetical protein
MPLNAPPIHAAVKAVKGTLIVSTTLIQVVVPKDSRLQPSWPNRLYQMRHCEF